MTTKDDAAMRRALVRELLAKIPVRSMEECGKADYLICGNESYFPDDVRTLCAICSRVIFHRPYQPFRPVRICMRCVVNVEGKLEISKEGR